LRAKDLLVVAAAALTVFVAMIVWQHRTSSDPQGNETLSCYKAELPSVPSSAGMAVTAHNTVCGDFGGTSAIYIYVHRLGEKESRQNLVFRYSERGDWELPKISWKSENELTIQVPRVVQVTKIVRTIGPVRIKYDIGQQDYPALESSKRN
jgi:hypothetical protein